MDVFAELEAPCSPEALFRWVESLDRYPDWLDIVHRAEAEATGSVTTEADDPASAGDGSAWLVDLRGRLGPLARSKRLRMVRSRHDPPHGVMFERREVDGRSHSSWVLRADVSPTAGGSLLTMHLHYGGGLWGPVIEHLLGDEIDRSRARLRERVAGR